MLTPRRMSQSENPPMSGWAMAPAIHGNEAYQPIFMMVNPAVP